jgi:hypothetical protein
MQDSLSWIKLFSKSHFKRSMFGCEKDEFFLLLQNLWIVVSAFNDLTVLSIHPKQRASSTASLYRIRFLPVFFNGYFNQISSSVSKFVSSHFLHSFLSMKYLVVDSFIILFLLWVYARSFFSWHTIEPGWRITPPSPPQTRITDGRDRLYSFPVSGLCIYGSLSVANLSFLCYAAKFRLPYYRRIRHLGFLSNRNKKKAIEKIREQLLTAPGTKPRLSRAEVLALRFGERSVLQCRECGGELLLLESFPKERAPPEYRCA